MNAYRNESSTLRPLFGAAAIALTALTFSLGVLVPASLEPAGRDDQSVMAAAAAPAPTEVAIIPARIEVIGARERKAAAFEQVRHVVQPKSKQAG